MYEQINEALNAIFFDGRYEDRPIYLVLTNAARAEFAKRLGLGEHEIESHACRAVGSVLAQSGDPYTSFRKNLFSWSNGGRVGRPPFTALLYTFAHAAELMVSDGTFSSANYYRRLSDLTGADHGRLSLHGVCTPMFWDELATWLSTTTYRYGRPTAQSTKPNIYVSLAISQAAVREADRQAFHHMFDRFRFSGTEVISEEDIYPYLDSWIGGNSATQRLQAAWTKPELRPRICEAAVAELEDWTADTGTGVGQNGERTSRLSLVAALNSRFMSRFLTLAIGREETLPAQISLKDGNTDASIENTSYGNFASVGPDAAVDITSILNKGATYERADGAGTYQWSPRLVIPFRRSQKTHYWNEVTRVTNGIEHLVLVRASLKDKVEKLLYATAQPGFTIATPERLSGLPADWLLYENVRVLQVLKDVGNELQALVPIASFSPIQLIAGLKLSRNIWHRYAPVTATITAPGKEVRIEATASSDGSGSPFETSDTIPNETKLRLDRHSIPASGIVFLSAKSGGETIATARFLSRSARNPKPLPPQAQDLLGYVSIRSAEQLDSASINKTVRGFFSSSSTELPIASTAAAPGRFTGEGSSEEDAVESLVAKSAASRVSQQARRNLNLPLDEIMKLSCVERGVHYWKIPTFLPDLSLDALIDIHCKQCDAMVVKRRREHRTKNAVDSLPAPPPVPASPEGKKRKSLVNYDLLLDALCFLGNGGWNTLETLTVTQLDEPWQLTSMSRDLAWLGYIDVELDKGKSRLKKWSVAPPVLAYLENGRAIFSGFRSQRMVKVLEEIVAEAGGTIERRDAPGQPRAIYVDGLTLAKATEKLASLKDPHGRKIRIVSDAPRRIASACVTFDDLFRDMLPMSGGAGRSLSKYDVSTGKWLRVDAFAGQGAYRNQDQGVLYAYRHADGRMVQGPHELVKLLDARNSGIALHSYDVETKTFRSRLGCEPIGLLGRALVASSGLLPVVSNGQSYFSDVAPIVASNVMNILYSGEIPR